MPTISNLPSISGVTGTIIFPVLEGPTTKKASFAQLSEYLLPFIAVYTVAGRVGNVTLSYTDVSGLSTVAHSGSYADLSGKPTTFAVTSATDSILGGVKVGSGLSVTADGTISVIPLIAATTSTLGGVKAGTSVSISGDGTISVTTASVSILGGVKVGSGLSVTADGTISTLQGSPATTSTLGVVKIGNGISVALDGTISTTPMTTATTSSLGGVIIGEGIDINAGVISAVIGPAYIDNTLKGSNVAIGFNAGTVSQSTSSVAVGYYAGYNSQAPLSVAVGTNAARTVSGYGSVSMGYYSSGSGDYSVAVGNLAVALGINSVAIGSYAGNGSTATSNIVINASGAPLSGDNEGLYISPVRQSSTEYTVYFNTGTNELTYGAAPTGGGGGVGLTSRTSVSATTNSIASGASANLTISGFKGYALLSIQVSSAAWVSVYSSTAARTSDSSRTITSDPNPGSGVVAEVITTGATTQYFSPALIGYSSEISPSTDVPIKVYNNSGSSTPITVTLTLIQLEA